MRLVFVILVFLSLILIFVLPRGFIELPLFNSIETDSIPNELPKLQPYPVPVENFYQAPEISARSAVVIDAKTGIALYQKDPNIRHFPASTTKLMTALVALERCSPETSIRVGAVIKDGTQMGIAQGDVVTVENLLYGMLIASGNDAAYVLAYSCSDSFNHFIVSMNQKSKELKMESTHFTNPAGFDDPMQYSTANDLAKLAKVAVGNPLISKIVATKSTVLTDVSGTKTYYLENINELLGEVKGIEGVKTGQTEGSLEILVTKTTRDDNTIIAVVLGSQDRFGESKRLIEWAFANHRWVNP